MWSTGSRSASGSLNRGAFGNWKILSGRYPDEAAPWDLSADALSRSHFTRRGFSYSIRSGRESPESPLLLHTVQRMLKLYPLTELAWIHLYKLYRV